MRFPLRPLRGSWRPLRLKILIRGALQDGRDARPPSFYRQSRISVSVRVWFEALARW
jgi:hypothetical protein